MPGAVTVAIADAVARIDPDRLAARVGIGHPGPADGSGRVARIAINLPGWVDVPLADWLEPMLARAVTCANDGNCAVLGEHHSGAARGCSDVVLLTLGTGVGGGVLLNGVLFSGHRGAAAEPGLIGLDPEGPPCNSGNRGSLESFCSIRGLGRLSTLPPMSSTAGPTRAMPKPWPCGSATASGWAMASVRSSTCSPLSWCWWGADWAAPAGTFCRRSGSR